MKKKTQPPDRLFNIGEGIAINLREILSRQMFPRIEPNEIIIVMKNNDRYTRSDNALRAIDWRVRDYLVDPSISHIETLW